MVALFRKQNLEESKECGSLNHFGCSGANAVAFAPLCFVRILTADWHLQH